METQDAIRSRYSVRGYTDEKLTESEIRTLVEAGLQAPTATNRQEIHFTIVDGSDPILKEIETEMTGGAPAPMSFYYNAPTVVILSGEEAFGWSEVDAGIAVENMSLMAESMGLGSLIIGCIKKALYGPKKEYFAKKLSFPEGYAFMIAIALGHKNAQKPPHTYVYDDKVSRI